MKSSKERPSGRVCPTRRVIGEIMSGWALMSVASFICGLTAILAN